MSGQPCPRCGGTDRFYEVAAPRNGGPPFWFCSQCKYREGAVELGSAAPASQASLSPDEITAAHAGYAAAAVWCAGALYRPEGAAALAWLHGRGFTDETIKAHEIGFHLHEFAITTAAVGRAHWPHDMAAYNGMQVGKLIGAQGKIRRILQGVITIPYTSGGITSFFRTRSLDPNARTKYLAPALPFYAGGPPSLYGADMLSEVDAIILTEGEFKSLAATQAWRANSLSMPAVGQPGIGYLPDEFLDQLAHKTVYLCYDSEARRDSRRLSPGERYTVINGEKLTGMHIPGKIKSLTAQLAKGRKTRTLTDDQAADIELQITVLERQIDTIRQRGITVRVLRLPRDIDTDKVDLDGFLLQAGAAALQALIDRARPFDEWYSLHGTCPAQLQRGGVWLAGQQLANYQAVVAEDILQDDGSGTCTSKHRFDLWGPQGRAGQVDIAAEVWADPKKGMGALRTGLHSGAASDEGTTAYQAIKSLSNRGDGPSQRVEYTALGWQEIDGQWHYLAPDGAITAHGVSLQHRATLDPAMNGNHYALCGPGDAEAGAAAFRSLLAGEASNRDEALLLASMAALALVHRFTGDSGRPAFWIYGYTGQQKTALVKVFLSLQGPAFTSQGSDGGAIPKWDSTPVGLELLTYAYRDALFCIDDYKQATTRGDAVPRMVHNYSESASRTRGRPDLKVQKGYPSRGIMIATAEDRLAGDNGQLARTILYKHPDNSVNLAALTAAQHAGAAGHLAAFWRGFIAALAASLDAHRGPEKLRARYIAYRDEPTGWSGHARVTSSLRALRAAFRILLLHMERSRVLAADEGEALVAAFDQAAAGLASEQKDVMTEEKPGNIALETMLQLLESQRAYIHDPDEAAADLDYDKRHARSEKIGEWRIVKGQRYAMIIPGEAMRLIQSQRTAIRQPIQYSQAAIAAQWRADGYLGLVEKGRDIYKPTHGPRVWAFTEAAIKGGYSQNSQSNLGNGNFSATNSGHYKGQNKSNSQNSQNSHDLEDTCIADSELSPATGDENAYIYPLQNNGNNGNSGNFPKIPHSSGINKIPNSPVGGDQSGNNGNFPATPAPRLAPHLRANLSAPGVLKAADDHTPLIEATRAAQGQPSGVDDNPALDNQAANLIAAGDFAGYEALKVQHPAHDWAHGTDLRYAYCQWKTAQNGGPVVALESYQQNGAEQWTTI